MNGYTEAGIIESKLQILLQQSPISEENAMEWLNLARTIRTTCESIEGAAKDILDKRTEKIAGWKNN